ncbi:energy-coupling factor transporter transmembrane component T [uncultured Actinomyces sp.]|uniref:energy-coupling factor transporter transmembrane component T n=1 Tax=uncultured Actinomyces sp. TaxID=249061 RepID=UPI002606947A|nr:energy-coupling factor transporter transmembrane component T [uncultured Actinomyces sp.]
MDSSGVSCFASTSQRPALREISPAESAPGESSSRLDPRTKLLALLVLNALVMRASPTTTLVAVQLLVVVALAWEVSARSALHTGFGCFICDVVTLGSPFLIAWMQSIGWPRSIVLIIGTCSAIMYWFARFFAGFGLALYVYRTTRIGQMKAALRAVHLPRVFVDALVVAFRVIPTVGAEAVAIRESMEMRGVDLRARGVLRHPLVIAERFLVPLLSSIARVADDLAASSVVRGLGGSTRPTSLTLLRATVWDALALGCVAVVIVLEFFCYLGVLP